MNAQDKPITPAEDRALEIAGRLVAEWNETRRDNLGALIRRIAAVLMEAEARGMERAAQIAEGKGIEGRALKSELDLARNGQSAASAIAAAIRAAN